MITKNYYWALSRSAIDLPYSNNDLNAQMVTVKGGNTGSTSYYPKVSFPNLATLMQTCVKISKTSFSGGGSSSTASTGVSFGNGTAKPTLEDYTYAGDLLTNYSHTYTQTIGSDEQGWFVKTVYTITNTGDEAFTISEVGLTCQYSSVGSYYRTYLYERTLLDEPVTIEAGGVGVVTYIVRFDPPTA